MRRVFLWKKQVQLRQRPAPLKSRFLIAPPHAPSRQARERHLGGVQRVSGRGPWDINRDFVGVRVERRGLTPPMRLPEPRDLLLAYRSHSLLRASTPAAAGLTDETPLDPSLPSSSAPRRPCPSRFGQFASEPFEVELACFPPAPAQLTIHNQEGSVFGETTILGPLVLVRAQILVLVRYENELRTRTRQAFFSCHESSFSFSKDLSKRSFCRKTTFDRKNSFFALDYIRGPTGFQMWRIFSQLFLSR